MAMIYVPDDLMFQVMAKKDINKQVFVKEAIEEKLEKET